MALLFFFVCLIFNFTQNPVTSNFSGKLELRSIFPFFFSKNKTSLNTKYPVQRKKKDSSRLTKWNVLLTQMMKIQGSLKHLFLVRKQNAVSETSVDWNLILREKTTKFVFKQAPRTFFWHFWIISNKSFFSKTFLVFCCLFWILLHLSFS